MKSSISLITYDEETKSLYIRDEAKLHKNGLVLVLLINLFLAIINTSRLYKETFYFLHGFWIFIGVVAVIVLYDIYKRNVHNENIKIKSILSYKQKKYLFNPNEQIVFYLINNKRRIVNGLSKKQIEEFEVLFQELNIPKHDSKKENIN